MAKRPDYVILRRNTDGSIDALPLPEAVSVLAELLSAEDYGLRLSIAVALAMGKTITAMGCTYELDPPGRRIPAKRRSNAAAE